jgi:hypothetical protein
MKASMDYPSACSILLIGQNTSKLQSLQVEKLWAAVSSCCDILAPV